jgi:phage shock protein E
MNAFMNLFTKTEEAFSTVDSNELQQIIQANGKEFGLIDVRTNQEHSGGHIPNSLNINLMSPDFKAKLEKLDKNLTYYVYCASGNRSKTACSQMNHMGFENVNNLRMGMMGWSGAIE